MKDRIPISIQEWKKPAKEQPDLTFVDQRAKDQLWESLMSHFTLPNNFTAEDVEKVKNVALRKMAIAFNNHKKTIWNKYIERGKKTAEFMGTLEKQRDHWDAFVKLKESELAQKRSRINKINASKKIWHHKLGLGGYEVARPKWDLAEQQSVCAGVTPVTLSWPSTVRTWFYAHGGRWTQR